MSLNSKATRNKLSEKCFYLLRPNILNTHWQQSDLNLAKGMDFVPRGDVFARFTHLQHVPYTMSIQVNNDSGAQRLAMVRVFLGPKFDERGSGFLFRDQRLLMIELDKFVAACEFIGMVISTFIL